MTADGRRSRWLKDPATFTSVGQVALKDVVFDKSRDMPGTVRALYGVNVEVVRPTGLTWRTHYSRLGPATGWERRQLVAVSRLRGQQRTGSRQAQSATAKGRGMRRVKTTVDDAARIVAGTVGDDVLTVHRLRVLGESTGDRRALCGAGGPQSETDEWSRAVNCPGCLAAPTK